MSLMQHRINLDFISTCETLLEIAAVLNQIIYIFLGSSSLSLEPDYITAKDKNQKQIQSPRNSIIYMSTKELKQQKLY